MTFGTPVRRFLLGFGMVLVLALVAAITGALAPVVWGGSSRAIGLLSGVASFVVALGIVWLLWIGARRPTKAADPLS